MKTKTCIFAILLAVSLSNSHAQDTWTQKANFPGGFGRYGAVGFSIGSKGYMGTGYDFYLGHQKDLWEYDPVTNAWTQKADLGGVGRESAVGFAINGKGYVGTGYNFGGVYKDFWKYDPVSNTWTQKADFGGTARYVAVGFSVAGKGYIGTGSATDGIKKDFWEYDPLANTWIQKADFGGVARYYSSAFSVSSKGYIGTGFDGVNNLKDFWEYDPANNGWNQKADFGGTARDNVGGISIGTKGYFVCGNDGSLKRDFWEYDPSANSWTQRADFGGAARWYPAGFSIGSKGYVGTGIDYPTHFNDFWEYTPATAQTNPVPLINQPLVPDAVAPGGPRFTLTVNGTGFVTGSVVNWNGSARATTFVSNSQLTETILASDIANASTASVMVVNPGPGGGESNAVFFPVTSQTSSVSLKTSEYAAGIVPDFLAIGDFNGDNKLDVAVSNLGGMVSAFLGNGDGTLQRRVDYAAGGNPNSVAVGDFNRDSKLDLTVANKHLASVSVLLGNGDGTFQAPMEYGTGFEPVEAVVGDFNGDGNLDLAVANYGPDFQTGSVSILLGNGDGTFQAHMDYPAGVNPTGVLVGDFNRDNKLDLAALNNNQPVGNSILLGNGDGSFQTAMHYTGGTRVGMVADFNSDGNLDLGVSDYFNLSISLGNGDGTFQPGVTYTVGANPNGVAGGDLNGDRKLDLVTANLTSNNVSVVLGRGDGTFQSHVDYGAISSPNQLAIGDFNADGRLDIVTANNVGTISVLLQGTTVALSESNLKFGVQLVGTTAAAQRATLTNSGGSTLTISSIAASGDFIAENNCGSSLPAGASCTIRVAFNPSAKGGRTGRVTITDDAADSPQIIKLKGTGTVVQVSPSALDFGPQVVGTTSNPLTATVTNIGSEDLRISGIGLGGANFGDFAQTTTCGSTLAAGGSCTIDVTFTPGARGHRHASLKIVDDGGASPQAVPLAGAGVPR